MIVIISIATILSPLLGGLFAIRFRDRLHLILGFSAGAVIGVAFFHLLPEAIELSSESYEVSFITSIVALGFVVFMILDRFIITHKHKDEENDCTHPKNRGAGVLSMCLHSIIDGIAIGTAFQVGVTTGITVAVAIIAHRFFDGINIVSLVLKNNGEKKQALMWLLVCALAPVVGIFLVSFITLSSSVLGLVLAIFCGFFLYIGASDLLPESHHSHPTIWTSLLTILGMTAIFLITVIWGHTGH